MIFNSWTRLLAHTSRMGASGEPSLGGAAAEDAWAGGGLDMVSEEGATVEPHGKRMTCAGACRVGQRWTRGERAVEAEQRQGARSCEERKKNELRTV